MKRKAGRPLKENLVAGFENLNTGEKPDAHTCSYFPSMKAAAYTLKMDIGILRDARSRDCPAFRAGGIVHRQQLIDWLAKEASKAEVFNQSTLLDTGEDEEDETGGVGKTLKSLQRYSERAWKALLAAEKLPENSIKTESVKNRLDAFLKIAQTLLKYDLNVSQAKRESGELIPLADAVKGIQALLAWHTVAVSDALRNVIPECEGQDKYGIARRLDEALRSSIYRNFKSGIKIGKIPEWMGREASDFVKHEAPLSLEKPKSLSVEDF